MKNKETDLLKSVTRQKTEHSFQVEILPETEDAIDDERESGVTHTPFQLEYHIYNAIREGDVQTVEEAIETYLTYGLIVGRLSRNTLRQIQYWAVACISVAIHYAILGGLDETDAYNLSDEYIRSLDKMKTMENCISFLQKKAVELTKKVHSANDKELYSMLIRRTCHYIHIHLHERLTSAEIAKQMGVTREYLSASFKKETGRTLHAYIIHEKLEASKKLLLKDVSYEKICYQYSFCSQTHYITCFKREYGMTPREYKNR